MQKLRVSRNLNGVVAALVMAGFLTTAGGCLRELYPDFLVPPEGGLVAGGAFYGVGGTAFSDRLLQERTFIDGASVTTVTYAVGDTARTKLGVDFNNDNKVDPVVGYGRDQAVVQILLSTGPAGTVDFISLTLDRKLDMKDLADVAVGDIDNDGALDVMAAAEGRIWYLHHPTGEPTTVLRDWAVTQIDSSFLIVSQEEIEAMIDQAVGASINLDYYLVTVEQRYTNVEIGDFNKDGHNDVAGSRSFKITLTPLPGIPLEPIEIIAGDVLVFANPGGAVNGAGWSAISIGIHERPDLGLDRDGASGLLAVDLDADGDLDVVSSAREDNNAQVMWFENPGTLSPDVRWLPWRVGSVRDAWSVDVGDVTGDGRQDVVAVGGEQMQLVLFEQPAVGPKRDFDWDTFVLATFETYEPRDVKVLDLDSNGVAELVVGGTSGAVRYFSRPDDPRNAWNAFRIVTYTPPGEVGLLGYGDIDGDGDLDLVAVVDGDEANDSQIGWIRNDTILLPGIVE